MMVSGEDDIYQDYILDHYEDPHHRGRCEHPTHEHQERNPLCGDVVHIDLALDSGGRIREIYFDGDGCCISQASASMLVEKMEGKTIADVKQFTAQDMLDLFGVRLTPLRQKCCLLSWRVLKAALHAPVNGDQDESAAGGSTFEGPNLDEES